MSPVLSGASRFGTTACGPRRTHDKIISTCLLPVRARRHVCKAFRSTPRTNFVTRLRPAPRTADGETRLELRPEPHTDGAGGVGHDVRALETHAAFLEARQLGTLVEGVLHDALEIIVTPVIAEAEIGGGEGPQPPGQRGGVDQLAGRH